MTLYDYWTKIHIACGVGVFLGRVNVKKLEAIQPAMFTEDKGSVRGGGGERRSPPWYKFVSLPCLPLSLKSEMAATIFAN